MILSLKTDSPLAQIELLDDRGAVIARDPWQADRALAKELHARIRDILQVHQKGWDDLTAVIIFRGPGSFTGLRIGVTVANALGYGLNIPIVGAVGETWQAQALERLRSGANDRVVLPQYGSEAHITRPKK